MTAQIDEETPLLSTKIVNKRPTPLPWFPFSILLVLQVAEPLTSNVIYPFAPQLIRELGITKGKESQVGYYVGALQSLFFLTEAITIFHWSRISDKIGRKPVIFTGLLGLSLSMYCFGLSKTFLGLVLSRSLCGALNGNIGVMRSMVAEMTDATNIANAYALIPLAWSTGATLGPVIGGSLAWPSERFPNIFGHNEFLKEYPYFLPCAIPATFSAIAVVITYLFLEETVAFPIPIAQFLGLKRISQQSIAKPSHLKDDMTNLPLRSLLTKRVIIAGGNYASLSLVDISFRAIQPLFLSTPISQGGLGLKPEVIGYLLSIFSVVNGLFQAFFFPRINDHYGTKNVVVYGIGSGVLVFSLFPIINILARQQGCNILVWVAVGLQMFISLTISLSFGAVFIYIARAAPNRASLGATNGLAQTTVSIMRAIGPALSNSLFSLSMEKQYLGGYLVYYVLLGVVCLAIVNASMLPRQVWSD